ncbi:MAG TPA: hypothetical protein VMR59_00175 [Patescibacteria group bacterium]|jgi:hypothetical protein|nr:hypothetical protein [Patescibacteria group bacterium]
MAEVIKSIDDSTGLLSFLADRSGLNPEGQKALRIRFIDFDQRAARLETTRPFELPKPFDPDANILGKDSPNLPLTREQTGRWFSATWKATRKSRPFEAKKTAARAAEVARRATEKAAEEAAKEAAETAKIVALFERSIAISPRPDLTGDETELPLTLIVAEKDECVTEVKEWPPKNEILRSITASIARGEQPEPTPIKPTPRRILGIKVGQAK